MQVLSVVCFSRFTISDKHAEGIVMVRNVYSSVFCKMTFNVFETEVRSKF